MSEVLEEYAQAHQAVVEARREWRGFIGGVRDAVRTLMQHPKPFEILLEKWPDQDAVRSQLDLLRAAEDRAMRCYAAIPEHQRSLVKDPQPRRDHDGDIGDIFENLFGNRGG